MSYVYAPSENYMLSRERITVMTQFASDKKLDDEINAEFVFKGENFNQATTFASLGHIFRSYNFLILR